ncbi:MAG: hypothetical protein SEPTF4163_006335 [Sporothrix epigloea]
MGKKKSSDPSDNSGSTTKDHLDNGPPLNLEEIQRRLARSRTTASPPESVYKDYAHTVGAAPNEATIVIEASGKLLEEYTGKGYKKAYNQAFTGYPKDVGFNNGLSAPQPDFVEGVEGVEGEEYRPFPIDKHVPGAVLYRDNPHSITLPHIAGEWKGPDGSMREAELQSRFDGAALINARTQALSYMGKSDPPSHAEVTTFTTDGKNISFFAHYAIEAEDSTLEYHQYPIKSTSLVNSHGGHKEGRKELRNAQGYAREQSYALKNQLQEHYKQQRGGLHPVATGVPTLPVPGEPLGAYEVVEHQPAHEPTPSKHRSGKAHSHHSHHSHHSRHSHHSHHTTPHSTKAASSTHGIIALIFRKQARQQVPGLLEEGRRERTPLPAALTEKQRVFASNGATTHWPHTNIKLRDLQARLPDGSPDPRHRSQPLAPAEQTDRLLKLAGVKAY